MDKHVHEQWLQDYENWKESGMTLTGWAREHGIKSSTFRNRNAVARNMLDQAENISCDGSDGSSGRNFVVLHVFLGDGSLPSLFFRSCLLRERCRWRSACLWPPPATRQSYRIADPVSSVKSDRLAADHTFSTIAFSFAIYWMVSMNI